MRMSSEPCNACGCSKAVIGADCNAGDVAASGTEDDELEADELARLSGFLMSAPSKLMDLGGEAYKEEGLPLAPMAIADAS